MAVCGKLHPVCQTVGQIKHEPPRGCRRTVANLEGQDHLAVTVNRRPCPNVASAIRCATRVGNVLVLGIDEQPDFIALDLLRLHVAHGHRG